MRPIVSLTALAALALAPPMGLAQAPEAEAPRYQIEIIVFLNLEGNPGDEDFHHGRTSELTGPPLARLRLPRPALQTLLELGGPEPAVPASRDEVIAGEPEAQASAGPDDGLELIERAPDAAGTRPLDPAPEAVPPGFRALSGRELTLGDVRRRLDNLRAYRVLGHAGWIQTGVAEDRAVPLDLKRLGITNPRGTITLWVGRYFHAEANLVYARGDGTLWTAPPPGAGLAPLEYAEQIAITVPPPDCPSWRRDTLCYLDHPLLGIILLASAAPEPEPSAAPASGPAG